MLVRSFTVSKLFNKISGTRNVINQFCTRYTLFMCLFQYCYLLEFYVKCAALYWTFISQSFTRGHNSNGPVAGGVVVDECGHKVCLPSVAWNVFINGGWTLVREVVNQGFYCICIYSCTDNTTLYSWSKTLLRYYLAPGTLASDISCRMLYSGNCGCLSLTSSISKLTLMIVKCFRGRTAMSKVNTHRFRIGHILSRSILARVRMIPVESSIAKYDLSRAGCARKLNRSSLNVLLLWWRNSPALSPTFPMNVFRADSSSIS